MELEVVAGGWLVGVASGHDLFLGLMADVADVRARG